MECTEIVHEVPAAVASTSAPKSPCETVVKTCTPSKSPSPSNAFACTGCSKSFPTRQKLRRHTKKHAERQCAQCTVPPFTDYAALRRHRAHAHPSAYACAECPAHFNRPSQLNKHRLSMHLNLVACTNAGCPERVHPHRHRKHQRECVYSSLNLSGRSSAAGTAAVGTPLSGAFVCNVCEKSFDSGQQLKKHTRTVHEGKKQKRLTSFNCDQCDKVFNLRSKFEAHMNKHKDLRPFCCPSAGCPKSYHGRDGLNEHVTKVHGKTMKQLMRVAAALRNVQTAMDETITN